MGHCDILNVGYDELVVQSITIFAERHFLVSGGHSGAEQKES
jgi:hypothetical protein